MKKSLLALTVSLAAVSGAHAAWDNGSVDGFGGNGELYLAIWDTNSSNLVSVGVDLGTTFNEFDANLTNTAFSKAYNLSSSALSVFAGANASDLHYTVFALSNGAFNPVVQQVMITTNAAHPTPNSSDVGNVINASVATASYINGSDTNYAANTTVVGGAGTANPYLGNDGVVGSHFTGQSLPFDITANTNQSLAFYEFNGPDQSGVADVKAVGTWSINLATGTLNYAAAPAVPVPGAAWLMGSALVGLGSIARRRRAA